MSSELSAGQHCRHACQAEDVVVLLDTAVMSLVNPQNGWPGDFPCRVVALQSDFQARLGQVHAVRGSVSLIDETELVGLMVSLAHCLSWR